ncbi:hypothetical protein V2I80_03435 [Pseudomonas viridiflava]|uniref:hypothetical protein n=1 Tax=Pseudomonas syringae group TaxID=136849 RepID=UPI002ECCF469|nr:hypothetical protein [Pseudomonas viridiflava]MEE3972502.1 hypothetical protein [Pseudomonas viridiflava]MEE4017343.1 hypothetical protein [Pseudomonas viridiflava]MEE4044484.1 hypothetical protein [Pseudomonas viridiflava]
MDIVQFLGFKRFVVVVATVSMVFEPATRFLVYGREGEFRLSMVAAPGVKCNDIVLVETREGRLNFDLFSRDIILAEPPYGNRAR